MHRREQARDQLWLVLVARRELLQVREFDGAYEVVRWVVEVVVGERAIADLLV